jgi:hypothetical protein
MYGVELVKLHLRRGSIHLFHGLFPAAACRDPGKGFRINSARELSEKDRDSSNSANVPTLTVLAMIWNYRLSLGWCHRLSPAMTPMCADTQPMQMRGPQLSSLVVSR